jgi:hypothetical protein
MLGSDTMVALALASVPLAWWLGILSVEWLYVVDFAMGSGLVIGGGAEQVYLTFLVGREGLIAAHAKFAATDSGIAPARTGHRRRPGAIAGRPACDPVQRDRLHRLDLEPAPRQRA